MFNVETDDVVESDDPIPDDFHPWDIIAGIIRKKLTAKPVGEIEQNNGRVAAMLLISAHLIEKGGDVEEVLDLFNDDDWESILSYNHNRLSVAIVVGDTTYSTSIPWSP